MTMMNFPFASTRRTARGFTLIELMITVAIIGILLRIAFPAYNQSVRKSRRADAKTALLDLAQREERYMSTANQYSTSAPALGYPPGTTFPITINAYYQLGVSAPNLNAFSATATATGAQVSDTQCKDFTVTSTGAQTVDGTSAATPSDCW